MESAALSARCRLAIISTHPIQYYSPWFRYLAEHSGLEVHVFYLWEFGVSEQKDREFGQSFQWDVPLLDGYESSFVENTSTDPGTHHFRGIVNPMLREQVEKWKPDAVLMFGFNFHSMSRFLRNWPRRGAAPLLLRGDSHNLNPSSRGMLSPLKALVRRYLFRKFSGFLYVGQANRDYYRDSGAKDHQLFFVPHCVDNERFISASQQASIDAREWRKEIGIPESDQVILFCGKFIETKRPLELLQAFRQAQLENVSLLYVGNGELEKELSEQSSGLKNVYFAPFQNQSRMPRTYAAADLIVLPSYGETWGLAINEAFCLGVPAIVSDHVGCHPDLIDEGKTGWTFRAGDVESLAHALEKAFDNPSHLKAMRRDVLKRITNYSYLEATKGLLAALQSLGVFVDE